MVYLYILFNILITFYVWTKIDTDLINFIKQKKKKTFFRKIAAAPTVNIHKKKLFVQI